VKVVYASANGHVNELSVAKGSDEWTHTDVTQLAGSPPIWPAVPA